jgi:MFS transporter, DHA2 family, glioxin efflux transporter
MDSRSLTLAEEKEIGTSTAPSPAASLRKEAKTELEDEKTDNEESVENGTNTDGEDSGEYPDGMRMAFIVIALLLSIFLVST